MIKCNGTHVFIESAEKGLSGIEREFIEIAKAIGEYFTPNGIAGILEDNNIIPICKRETTLDMAVRQAKEELKAEE